MGNKSIPLSPTFATKELPDFVIDAVNAQIKKNYKFGPFRMLQKDLIKEIMNLAPEELNLKRQQIFDEGYLEIESVYNKAGWVVTYDGPGYNESYEPVFIFAPKKKKKS